MQRSHAVSRDVVVLVAGLIAVPLVFLVGTTSRAAGDADPSADPLQAMTADSAGALLAGHVVAPAQEPPGLSYMMGVMTRVDDAGQTVGSEADYHHGDVQILVCESSAAENVVTSCDATDSWSVLREETVDGRRVQVAAHPGWVVPASEADIPEGDRIAEILWWWASTPLVDSSFTDWVPDLAGQPGMAALLGIE